MNADDPPIATSSSPPLPGLTAAVPPSTRALDVDVVGRRLLAFLLDLFLVLIIASVVSALFDIPVAFNWLLEIIGFLGYKISAEAIRSKTLGKRALAYRWRIALAIRSDGARRLPGI